MKYKELTRILKKAKEIKKKIGYYPSILIEGRAGIGKSTIIKQFAEKEGFEVVDIRLINYDIGDFLLKVPELKENKLKNAYNEWLIKLATTQQPVILLLDEIDKATPQIQRLAYQLILDREVEGLKLSNNVMIIAIQNTTEDGQFFSIENEKPLYDRFYFRVQLDFDEKEWLNWAISRLDKRIVAFLTKNKEFIYLENEEKLIATPRRWEFLSNVISDVRDLKELETLTEAIIDKERAIAFVEFLEIANKYRNLREILEKEELEEIDKRDFYALAMIISEELAEMILVDKKKVERLFNKMREIVGLEYLILIIRFMLRSNNEKREEIEEILLEMEVVNELLDILLED